MAGKGRGCVLVIGLDGATFKVLGPLMDEGGMPNLRRIRDEGAHGVLMSTVPPLSGPAWTSFFTGLNPGRHGVFSWRRDPRRRDAGNLVNSRTVIGDKLWTLFGRGGLRSCIMGVPVTYPPEEVEGIMVTGVLTPLDADVFTHPPGLSAELRAMGYRTDYEFSNDEYDGQEGTRRALYEEIKALTESRLEAARLLVDRGPWDLFVVMYSQTDQVQHFFWDDKGTMAEFFGIMDDHIGALREMFSERYEHLDILVMSDHGFDAAPTRTFALNAWLDAKGLVSKDEKEARSALFEVARKVGRGLKKVGIDLGKTRLGRKRFDEETKKVLDRKLIVLEGHGLYIDVEQAGDRFEAIRDDLVKGLRDLVDPDGNRVFKGVWAKEEVYHGDGKGMEAAPDVVFVPDPDYYIDPGLLATEVFAKAERGQGRRNWTGMHNGTPEGVLLMAGHGVRRGTTLGKANIIDIAPTILHLAGLPVPRGMDGAVLEEALEPGFLEGRPVSYSDDGEGGDGKGGHEYSEEEAKDVERRLRSLGYLD